MLEPPPLTEENSNAKLKDFGERVDIIQKGLETQAMFRH